MARGACTPDVGPVYIALQTSVAGEDLHAQSVYSSRSQDAQCYKVTGPGRGPEMPWSWTELQFYTLSPLPQEQPGGMESYLRPEPDR